MHSLMGRVHDCLVYDAGGGKWSHSPFYSHCYYSLVLFRPKLDHTGYHGHYYIECSLLIFCRLCCPRKMFCRRHIQYNNGHGGQYDQVLDKREPGNNNNGYKKGITSVTTTSIIDGTNTETANGTRETTTQESNPTYQTLGNKATATIAANQMRASR